MQIQIKPTNETIEKEINFSYDSFFNTIEKREDNKKVVKFMQKIKTEFLNVDSYFVIGGEMCYDENLEWNIIQ